MENVQSDGNDQRKKARRTACMSHGISAYIECGSKTIPP